MLLKNQKLQLCGNRVYGQLCQAWPSYQKPADARTLAAKFSLNDLLRVAKVDSELNALLSIIGLKNK